MAMSACASVGNHRTPPVLATALYLDPDDPSSYPQMYDQSSVGRIRLYTQCAAVALASARLTNPEADIRLVVGGPFDLEASPDVLKLLSDFDVSVQHADFGGFAPPEGRSKQFAAAFFTFRAVEILGALPRESRAILFDSDCVWLAPADSILRAIASNELGCYPQYTVGDLPEGDPRRVGIGEAALAVAAIPDAKDLTYFGGEFLAGEADMFKTLGESLLDSMLHAARWSEQRGRERSVSVFDNDEFLLSATLNLLDVGKAWHPNWIRRIHTNTRTFDAEKADLARTILHLPGEKRRGFRRIFDDLARNAPPGGSLADDPRRWLQRLGVPKRSFVARMRYALPAVRSRLGLPASW